MRWCVAEDPYPPRFLIEFHTILFNGRFVITVVRINGKMILPMHRKMTVSVSGKGCPNCGCNDFYIIDDNDILDISISMFASTQHFVPGMRRKVCKACGFEEKIILF